MNVSNNVVFPFSVQIFQSAGSVRSRALFRGGMFTRRRFPDLESGTSNHRTMSAQQLLDTQQTLRLKNFVKKNNEFITYPISVEKIKEEVEGDSGDTDYTMCRLENIVKKHREFSPSVEKSKNEVEGDTDYKAVLITLFFTVSALVCFFRKAVVSMGSSKKGSITMVSASCSIVLCVVLLGARVSLCWLLCSFCAHSAGDTMSSSVFRAFPPRPASVTH